MVEQAVRRVVEQLVANAPEGWTKALLVSRAGPGGTRVSGGYDVPGASARSGRVPNPYKELMALAEALREIRGWQHVTVEIVCRPSGHYELVATTDAITSLRGLSGGFQAVLDADYRLPQPGSSQEEATAAPAGDPELAVARFREYLQRRAAILGGPEQLPPPASPAAIEEAERRLGVTLPDDLRALYLVANGDGIAYQHRYLLEGYGWMDLASLVAVHAEHREPAWHGWNLGWDWIVFDADPPETVRRCGGGHPAWIPIATGEDGNYLAVDLSPARNGRPGQVIYVGRDYGEGPAYVADSVTSLLGRYLTLLEQGNYEARDGYINLPETAPSAAPREIVDEIPDRVPSTLQAIHINDAASPVDLAPLTAAANLRRIHLNRCSTADLAPLHALPVESLRVTLDGGDLTPLRGHQYLRSLDLAAHAPVDIAPLASAPNLRGLDLSQADVRDLTVLADLTELRYLALTAQQWDNLLEEAKAPPALAAARLADRDASLDQALSWSARLGVDTGATFRTAGRLADDVE